MEKDLSTVSIFELIQLETISKVICNKFESEYGMNKYTFNDEEKDESFNKFKKFSTIREKILSEMENRLEKIIGEE